MDCQLQTVHPCLSKGFLGVKRTTTNWAILFECGQVSLQFYWFRADARFYNAPIATLPVGRRQGLRSCLLGLRRRCWPARTHTHTHIHTHGVAPPLLACTHRMSMVDWRSSMGGGDGPAHTHRPSQLLLELHLGSLNAVQDEQHAVFLCPCMQLCSLCLI